MKNLLLLFAIIPTMLGGTAGGASSSKSFMSDKTEVSVNLEVSGAEALCQTDDGYVWIAQYSGLTRYDSKEYVTYKSFVEDGVEHSIINVRALASKGNTLYIATYKNIFIYEDYHFSYVNVDAGVIKDIVLDDTNDLLYISSSDQGATLYDLKTKTASKLPNVETGNVNDIALDVKRNNYYYQLDSGLYDKDGKEIHLYPNIYDVYSYGDILYIGEDNGTIRRYNMATKSFLDDIVIPDQVNRLLYSEEDKILFVACEQKGLFCVNLAGETPIISLAGDLENKNQLVDLMIDYQGNLWIASHFIGASGVSIITKNALLELLYDDEIWKELSEDNRGIYAIERYRDILYIMSAKRIYLYDLSESKILPDNAIMTSIDTIADGKTFSPRDMEVFNGKIYFAVNGIGLVQYNPDTEEVVIYDTEYIFSHVDSSVGDVTPTNSLRSLRSFDNYLAIGYSRGIMKFDGDSFSIIYVDANVLYINKTKDGKLIFNKTQGIFEVADDFQSMKELPTIKGIDGNILKFLVDGDYIYYTLNSRLFRLRENNGEYTSEEVIVPYVKGSIVELSKIEYTNKNGQNSCKYVIASQTQIYIADTLEGDQLVNYEFYDASNGLRPIAANTSGYYDRDEQCYYFQTTDGIFAYDFNETKGTSAPVKICIASIELDGQEFYGSSFKLEKNTYRVTINLSIFGFKPHKGYTIYYKMDGVDNDYHTITDEDRNINYTNLAGGSYRFHAYAIDEYGQVSNVIDIYPNYCP